MNSMDKTYRGNGRWFVMVYVIAVTFGFALMFYGIVSLVAQMGVAHDYVADSVRYDVAAKNRLNSATALHATVNSDWGNEDRLSCSGWVILCSASWASCSSNQWMSASDGIDDDCDDDDGTPGYSTGSVGGLLAPDSIPWDDDDAARIVKTGFVGPGETVTVFEMNSKIATSISLRPDNASPTVRAVPTSGNFRLRCGLSSATGSVSVFKLDKVRYDDAGETVVLDKKSGSVVTADGIITSDGNVDVGWTPYFFDAATYDYAIRITNPSQSSLFFQISGTTGGIPTYLVPIEWSGTSTRLVPPPYYGSALK